MKNLKQIIIALIVMLLFSSNVHAQDTTPIQNQLFGKIIKVEDTTSQVEITKGDRKGQVVTTINNPDPAKNNFKVGDHVLLLEIQMDLNNSSYYITDHNRIGPILLLFVIFCLLVVAISKKWGLLSILGMIYSFFIVFKFTLPFLLKGTDPLLITILSASLIAPVTFYLSHGINKKTTIALISTILTLVITGLFATVFVNLASLTGFGSDESFFLQIAKDGIINIKGIFLAGIIIGVMGILDDITISQAAIVFQLKKSTQGLSNYTIYKKAMEIGHDHIASAVNTLVLVYAGAALPLLLLFTNSTLPLSVAINSEIIADEIVRTLIGSIGLVLAVPISTHLASNIQIDSSES